MKKCFFILALTLVAYFTTNAQNFSISGRIYSKTDSIALASCNIVLKDKADKFLQGTISDNDGKFKLNKLNNSNYTLIISTLGYYRDTLHIQLSTNLDIGNIYLGQANINLNEVPVNAKYTTTKDGIKYIYPSLTQIKNSSNSMQVLEKIPLARLYIDAATNSIYVSGGGKYKFLINGREASMQEIKAIRPHDIKRIEYHDMPEARYDYADIVVNLIVKHQNSGGFIYTELWNSKGFGEDYIVAKHNYKKSGFKIIYYLAYRNWTHLWRENQETFNFSDSQIHRYEKGFPANFEYYNQIAHANYSFTNQKNYLIIKVGVKRNNFVNKTWKSQLFYSNTSSMLNDSSGSAYLLPYLDIYYQHSFNDKQLIIVNATAVYNNGNFKRSYSEMSDNTMLSNIYSDVSEEQKIGKYSLLYQNKTKLVTIDFGLKGENILTRDQYNNNSIFTDQMNWQNMLIFTDFSKQLNSKFYYRLSLGANFYSVNTAGRDQKYMYMRPTLSLKYSPNKTITLNYYSDIKPKAPLLSELSNYEQNIDSIQIRKGNPNLKPQIKSYNAIAVQYSKNKFGLNYYVNYSYYFAPIMENSYLRNKQIIRTTENHKNFQKINTEIEGNLKLFKHLRFRAYTGINHYLSKGNSYMHQETIWYYGGKIAVNYKKFTLSYLLHQNVYDNFWGETLTKLESANMIAFSYNTNKLTLGIDILDLLSDKPINNKKNYNKTAPYYRTEYLSELKNLIRFKVAYNFSYGKKFKTKSRLIKNSVKTESGILKGEK